MKLLLSLVIAAAFIFPVGAMAPVASANTGTTISSHQSATHFVGKGKGKKAKKAGHKKGGKKHHHKHAKA